MNKQIDVSAHPEMARIIAESAQMQREKALQVELDRMEAQRVRAEQGRYLNEQVKVALAEYELAKKAMHQVVGKVFLANQAYQRATGVSSPDFLEPTFTSINLPSMKPSNNWSVGFTTTQAAAMAWFASHGKTWE